MKTWTTLAAALAFVVGLSAPVVASSNVSAWEIVQENPGTNCTIGRAVINNTTGNSGSTVRSKSYCSEAASDVNLPADRMGVLTYALHTSGTLCGYSGSPVYNSQGTAVKSVTATVICYGDIIGYGRQYRKINSTDWAEAFNHTALLYFAP